MLITSLWFRTEGGRIQRIDMWSDGPAFGAVNRRLPTFRYMSYRTTELAITDPECWPRRLGLCGVVLPISIAPVQST